MKIKRRDLLMALAGVVLATPLLLRKSEERSGFDHTDIRTFGAVGDGQHDDAPAIQAAINSDAAVLYFPPGTYRLGHALQPRSGQTWTGAGVAHTILRFGGDPSEAPFNLVHDAENALHDLTVQDIHFYGGRTNRLVYQKDGQAGFAFYLRGSLQSLTIRRCRFQHFGDGGNGGGGLVLGPHPNNPDAYSPSQISIEDCFFSDNSNVPGIYLCAGSKTQAYSGAIRIRGNHFEGTAGSTRIQNSLYILGSATTPLRQVIISGNLFDYASPVDVGIELNWVEEFIVSANTIRFSYSVPMSSGILIRDGSKNGVVSSNILSSTTREPTLRGIAVVNFQHPQQIHNVLIKDNVLEGISESIAIDRGSTGIIVSGNRISGNRSERDSLVPPPDGRGFGIRIVDSRDTQVTDNLISDVPYGILVGVGDRPESRLDNIFVERNRFIRCGTADAAAIMQSTELPADRLGALTISGNGQDGSAAALISPRLQELTVQP